MPLDTSGLGRRSDLAAELEQLGEPGLSAGRVLAQHRGFWLVAESGADEPSLLQARGRLRDSQPVTGDWVAIDSARAIAHVLERRGTIVRRAAGERTESQVLAANVDLALAVEPLPDPNERRVERFVALALADGVRAALVLTKSDLDDDAQQTAARLARHSGVADALAISVVDGTGIGPLRGLLEPGTTTVLLGPSGAGKSTLVNELLGEQRQAVGAIREGDGRGRHTTVTRELIRLESGALMIDTPGIREVGLWEGTGDAFDDIDQLALSCKFADCRHEGEPGCAVRDAVDAERLEAWRKLEREQAWIDDRKAAAREREQRGKSYSRIARESQRAKGRDV
jgi:ribosome biogenesis GTPase